MIKQAYEAGVKQAFADALSPAPVGSPAIKQLPAAPQPIASPSSPTAISGNKISPAATMAPKPNQTSNTEAYNQGVKEAMAAAGLMPAKPASPAMPMTPPSHATRPANITQPTGGDMGSGGSGLGKSLLNTGGNESLGKLAALSPLAKYVGAGALGGAALGGIAGQDIPSALKGAVAGGAAGLGAHALPKIVRGSGKLEKMISENLDMVNNPSIDKFWRGMAAEDAQKLIQFQREGGGTLGKVFGTLGGIGGGGAGLGLGALLSPSEASEVQ